MKTKGKVTWFDNTKGFGFAAVEGVDEDIFIHYSAIRGKGYKSILPGQEIDIEYIKTDKGYRATKVIAYANK